MYHMYYEYIDKSTNMYFYKNKSNKIYDENVNKKKCMNFIWI